MTTALSAERRLIYADSSALVKLVIDEPESAALERHLEGEKAVLATSQIALVEVSRAAAIANPAGAVRDAVDALLGSCMMIAVSEQLLRSARGLASATVRTLDAIHLASALRIAADELVAYDRHLLTAAAVNGLAVASPRP